jgi:hypothetical protein
MIGKIFKSFAWWMDSFPESNATSVWVLKNCCPDIKIAFVFCWTFIEVLAQSGVTYIGSMLL